MYKIAALYKFAPVSDPQSLRDRLWSEADRLALCGTLLVAKEGINGTIAGMPSAIDEMIEIICREPGFENTEHKVSSSPDKPFRRLKVRLKKEIVTMGQPDVDPLGHVGHYVEPAEWNDLLQQEDVVVIDTRNDYEVAIGTFQGAINPKTESFREFPKWWEANKDRFRNQRVAMFCTGGIRCEKSTSFLVSQGIEDVFHLKGGILKYLEDVPKENSMWDGDCFVFDSRVSVGHGLKIGDHKLCFGCRRPLEPEDLRRSEYEAGVSCHHCYAETTEDDKERFRERQRQAQLAAERR